MHNCCGVLPSDVISANRIAKMRELDAMLCGIFVSRAAISDVQVDAFDEFMENYVNALLRYCEEHPISLDERLGKAKARYRLDG